MRLIDRIRSGPLDVSPDAHSDEEELLRGILDSPMLRCVDIQNVRDWVWAVLRGGSDYTNERGYHHAKPAIARVFPLAALPFDPLWCEYIEGRCLDGEGRSIEAGLLFSIAERRLIEALGGEQRTPVAILCNLIMAGGYRDAPTHTALFRIEVNDDFTPGNIQTKYFIDRMAEIEGWKTKQDRAQLRQHGEDWAVGCLVPGLAAISFFHCSNVRTPAIENTRQMRRAFERERPGHKMAEFIEIHLPTPRSAAKSAGETTRDLAAHFVRAHFKRFLDPTKPGLFGNRHGMWLWKVHKRGDGAAPIRKYRVHPPDPPHAPGCIVK